MEKGKHNTGGLVSNISSGEDVLREHRQGQQRRKMLRGEAD